MIDVTIKAMAIGEDSEVETRIKVFLDGGGTKLEFALGQMAAQMARMVGPLMSTLAADVISTSIRDIIGQGFAKEDKVMEAAKLYDDLSNMVQIRTQGVESAKEDAPGKVAEPPRQS